MDDVRDPVLTRILRDAMLTMERASTDDAELAVVAFAAGAIERHGDSDDAISDLSDHAIRVRGHHPDAVQAALAKGITFTIEERAERQAKANGHNGHGSNGHHANGVGQGPNGLRLKPEPPKPWRELLVTAAALKTKTFPPLRYILPDIIPEGATLLVSRPKLGKSWLVLDLAIATAASRFTLGDLKPSPGAVLYLALEDSERRLQRRMDKLLLGEWPANLTFATEWPRADQGGLDAVEEWLKTTPDARLVVVDTLAHFRPMAPGKIQGSYQDDYAAMAPLQKLAGKYRVAIIVVHHDRKMEADDVFDTVSGTLGLTGASDTMLVMKRQAGNVTLHVRGRDIEEAEKALEFNKDTCKWTIMGEAADVARSTQRGRVLDALRQRGDDGLSPAELAAEIDITRDNAKQILKRMADAGDIEHRGKGRYGLVSPLSPGDVTGKNECNISDLHGDSGTGDSGDSVFDEREGAA